MMHLYEPNFATALFLYSFFAVYIALLAIRVIKNKVDLYDFFMLGMLGLIPLLFVVFPRLTSEIAYLVGVEYPFLILFGALNLVTFLMLYRLIRRYTKLNADMTRIVQEVGTAKLELSQLRKNLTPPQC